MANGEIDDDHEEDDEGLNANNSRRRYIAPNEGHYRYENDNVTTKGSETEGDTAIPTTLTTYLEGHVFYGLLQDDMPVELWTGSSHATRGEMKLPDRARFWVPALVVAVIETEKVVNDERTNDDSSNNDNPPCTVHVSYLVTPDATEETIVKNVPVRQIRIVMGPSNNNDDDDNDKIPETLEEARLLAMGGEEIHVNGNGTNQKRNTKEEEGVNETTGLTGWSTVSVKRTTVKQLHREERDRQLEKRRQVRHQQEAEARKLEERKMEEAKVSNADDSALGAYDVWGRGGGYKGVDISQDDSTLLLSVQDTAKRLVPPSSGGTGTESTSNGDGRGTLKIAFRKAKKKKGGARRTTSADDD